MKKLMLIAFIFLSATMFGQFRTSVLVVPNSSTAFGVSLPANSLVYDATTKEFWSINSFATSTTTLLTASNRFNYYDGAWKQNL